MPVLSHVYFSYRYHLQSVGNIALRSQLFNNLIRKHPTIPPRYQNVAHLYLLPLLLMVTPIMMT